MTPVLLRPGEIPARSIEDVFIGKVMKAVEEHLSEETFHLDELADSIGMSKVQLHRKLTALTGQAPGELIRSFRLHRAMEMLQKNAGTVAEIAYAVGFNDPSYFSKSFHKQFGRSPGDVKKG